MLQHEIYSTKDDYKYQCNFEIYQWKNAVCKISLKSFVYDMIDVYCFPTEKVKIIYDKYNIIKCHVYLNLTYTDSSSCFSISSAKKNVILKSVNREI